MLGPRYGEGLTTLSDLFERILENSREEAEGERELERLLGDGKLLRQLWKQGTDIDWDREEFDYRFIELPGEKLVVLVYKMVGGLGHVEVTAGIFEQVVDIKGVERVGMVPDGRREGFRHVGRYKDHRGNQGDVYWRLLIQAGESVKGSLLKEKYGHKINKGIDAIKNKSLID